LKKEVTKEMANKKQGLNAHALAEGEVGLKPY
jgi:hypothetical protein